MDLLLKGLVRGFDRESWASHQARTGIYRLRGVPHLFNGRRLRMSLRTRNYLVGLVLLGLMLNGALVVL